MIVLNLVTLCCSTQAQPKCSTNPIIIIGGSDKTSYKTYTQDYNGSALTLKNYINYNNHCNDKASELDMNFSLSLVNFYLLKGAPSNTSKFLYNWPL